MRQTSINDRQRSPARWSGAKRDWTPIAVAILRPERAPLPCALDDSPYAKAQLETLKYQPDFPARFGYIEDATAPCQAFFAW
jgi:hypothetical protein